MLSKWGYGNVLVGSNAGFVRETDRDGKTVWEFTQVDSPSIRLFITQAAYRLTNGNAVIAIWCPVGNEAPKNWNKSVQLIEVTPEKKVGLGTAFVGRTSESGAGKHGAALGPARCFGTVWITGAIMNSVGFNILLCGWRDGKQARGFDLIRCGDSSQFDDERFELSGCLDT